MRRALLILSLGALSAILLGPAALTAQGRFPHDKHSLFFSDCSVCHGGITADTTASSYPEASFCGACHDGTTAPAITWEPPETRLSNLKFEHPRHDFGCAVCHLPGGEENLAQLDFPQPETCFGCHLPDLQDHFAAEQCDFCHVPVVEARVTQDRISEFPPRPPMGPESSCRLTVSWPLNGP